MFNLIVYILFTYILSIYLRISFVNKNTKQKRVKNDNIVK